MAEEVGGPVGGGSRQRTDFFMETAQLGIVPCHSLCLRSHFLKVVLSPPGGQASPFTGTPGRKVMTNLDSILKRRDITLPIKVRLVKAMVFPVVSCMDVRVGL